MNEFDFDGRCGIFGNTPMREVKCKRCGQSSFAIFNVEGQTTVQTLIDSVNNGIMDVNNFINAYIINVESEEVQDGGHKMIVSEGLLKCPHCFYVNTIIHRSVKQGKENSYKNFD